LPPAPNFLIFASPEGFHDAFCVAGVPLDAADYNYRHLVTESRFLYERQLTCNLKRLLTSVRVTHSAYVILTSFCPRFTNEMKKNSVDLSSSNS